MVKHALRIYEDSLHGCGHSMLLTQAADAKIAYRTKTVTCQACAAGERGREKDPAPGEVTFIEDLRDTPGAMDTDADDIIWMPDDDSVPVDVRYSAGTDGLDRYAETAPAAATASPATSTTAAIVPLPDRASEHFSA